MEEKRLMALDSLKINGLTKNNEEYLAYWYSYETGRRNIGRNTYYGWIIGSPKIDKYAIRKGKKIISYLISTMGDFEEKLEVEPITYYGYGNNIISNFKLKCKDKNGNNVLIDFASGDDVDYPSVLSVVTEDEIKQLALFFPHSELSHAFNIIRVIDQSSNPYYKEKLIAEYKKQFEENTDNLDNEKNSLTRVRK